MNQRIAPLPKRLFAGLVDCLLLALLLTPALLLDSSLLFLTALVAYFIVNDVIMVVKKGCSVGKLLTGLRITDARRDTNPSWRQATLRLVVVGVVLIGVPWHASFLPTGVVVLVSPWPLVCYGAIVFDRRTHRGLHDRAAGVVVVDLHR